MIKLNTPTKEEKILKTGKNGEFYRSNQIFINFKFE